MKTEFEARGKAHVVDQHRAEAHDARSLAVPDAGIDDSIGTALDQLRRQLLRFPVALGIGPGFRYLRKREETPRIS